MPRRSLLVLIGVTLLVKVGYLLFSMVLAGETHNQSLLQHYLNDMYKNDVGWYKTIATEGYPEVHSRRDLGYSKDDEYHQSAWAFFPMYPLLNRATMWLTGWNYLYSALFWSILLSASTAILLAQLGFVWFKNTLKALYFSLLMVLFPFAFYYSMFYTEALFMSLLLGTFLAVHHRRYMLLAALLIPLSLVRPNGIVVLVPLYLYHLEARGWLMGFSPQWKGVFSRQNILHTSAFLTAPLAFLAYCYYQWLETGYFFAFSIAQQGWYREFMFPLLALFRQGDAATQFNSVFTIVLILFAVWSWRKLPLSFNVLVWIGILLPLTSGSVTSMTRFATTLFPLFLVLSATMEQLRLRYLLLLLAFALQLWSYTAWLHAHPLSY
ncbi:MAG: hypothetical protein EA392_13745 [Cryomorphaceae bacterium]|nr:MAG: hypothetical protein EA392_13745 [Cryomorphaceae bacterium]